jgi:hypothetical protein
MNKTVTRAVAMKLGLKDLRRVTVVHPRQLAGVTGGLIQKFAGGDVEADITQLPIAHNY